MVFSSLTFIIAFLPITVIAYFCARRELKTVILLISSLIFYAWGEPVYVVLMLLSIAVNYGLAIAIYRWIDMRARKNALFLLAIAFNIALIGVFKYGDFIIRNVNNVLGTEIHALELALPIGISFYTFQILSYIIDVWKGKSLPQRNIVRLGTYISLFPQLIAGPIVKYEDIEKQLDPDARKINLQDISYGLKRFVIGLGKKVIIANQMGFVVSNIQELSVADASRTLLWICAICYVYQLYFDFSGYSDMAIGLSRMFGFRFPENFRHPFASRTAAEFWQRFHISLISWFREYVYFPLGGNRVSAPRWVINILAVWMLTGLWHGADWNFVLWGLSYAIIMIAEGMIVKRLNLKQRPALGLKKYVGSILGWAWAMFAYTFTCIIFRLTDMHILLATLKKMFYITDGSGAQGAISYIFSSADLIWALLFFPIAFFGAFPVVSKLLARFDGTGLGGPTSPELSKFGAVMKITINIYYVAVFYASLIILLGATYNPFIYFRF
jgi:alginate O-acetyltransferase complex protein AlgI